MNVRNGKGKETGESNWARPAQPRKQMLADNSYKYKTAYVNEMFFCPFHRHALSTQKCTTMYSHTAPLCTTVQMVPCNMYDHHDAFRNHSYHFRAHISIIPPITPPPPHLGEIGVATRDPKGGYSQTYMSFSFPPSSESDGESRKGEEKMHFSVPSKNSFSFAAPP